MALRTQEFSWLNYALADGVIVDASSASPSNPLSFFRHPWGTMRWRSKTGVNIVDNWNDRFPFRENGVLKQGVLSTGNYTPAAAAAMTEGAINAAATNGYTFTYDGAGLYTLTRVSGIETVGISGVTGDNGRSAHADFGYLDTEHTGATFYTSDFLAYHSREWVRFDLGTFQTVERAKVYGFNTLANGTIIWMTANVRDVMWAAATGTGVFEGDDLTRLRIDTVAQVRQYWLIVLKDQRNPEGYSELAIPFIGPAPSIMTVGTKQGWNERGADGSIVTRADLGGYSRDQRPSPRSMAGTFQTASRQDRDAFRTMHETIGLGGHLFFANDATNYPASEELYCVLSDFRDVTAGPGDGSPVAERYDMRWAVTEEPQ